MLRVACRASFALGVVATAALADGQDLPRLGCDPVSFSAPAPIPAGEALVCGDGRANEFVRECHQECSGGCPGASGCGPIACMRERETCDGDDLGDQSCESLGFTAGTLRCRRDCAEFDTSACEPCASADGVRCQAIAMDDAASQLHLARIGDHAFVAWQSGADVAYVVAGSARRRARVGRIARATLREVIAVRDGVLVAVAGESGGRVLRIDARGALRAIDLPDGVDGGVWPLGDGFAVVSAWRPGGGVRWIDARLRPWQPRGPAHGVRPNGARALLVPADGVREASEAGGMRIEWPAGPDTWIVGFVDARASGIEVIRDGRVVTGMGWIGDTPTPLRVHIGRAPSEGPRAADPLWARAIPDSPREGGSGTLTMQHGIDAFDDAWRPHLADATVYADRRAAPATLARPVFAQHATVTQTHVVRVGARGAALAVQTLGDTVRLWLATGVPLR